MCEACTQRPGQRFTRGFASSERERKLLAKLRAELGEPDSDAQDGAPALHPTWRDDLVRRIKSLILKRGCGMGCLPGG
jgi:hypothetical protein